MIDDDFRRQAERFKTLCELDELQEPGDIIFVRGDGITALLNCSYQRVAGASIVLGNRVHWAAVPSHVLVVVAPGLYLHSMPAGGVHFVRAEEYPLSSFPLLKVMRRNYSSDAQKEVAHEELQRAAQCHIQQRYNFKINLTLWTQRLRSHSYCSQLVAQVYELAHLPISSRPPRQVLPIHLLEACSGNAWSDVTEDYRRFERLLPSIPEEDRALFNMNRWTLQLNTDILLDTMELQTYMENMNSMLRSSERAILAPRRSHRFQARLLAAGKKIFTEQHPPSKVTVDVMLWPVRLYLLSTDDELGSTFFSSVFHWNAPDAATEHRRREDELHTVMGYCLDALAYVIAAMQFVAHAFANDASDTFRSYRDRGRQCISFAPDLLVALSAKKDDVTNAIDEEPNHSSKLQTTWRAAVEGYIYLGQIHNLLGHTHNESDLEAASDLLKQLNTLIWCRATFRRLSASEKKRCKARHQQFLRLLCNESINLHASAFNPRDRREEESKDEM